MSESIVNSPIFIVGTPRSGTTLTAKILGKHSRLFMPGETHFFDDIYSRRDELGPFSKKTIINVSERLFNLYSRYYEPDDQRRIEKLFLSPESIRDEFSDCLSYADMLNRFMCIQMKHENKSRWGNNAPRDLFSMDDILEFYPDAKIIVCVRDVRAFLLSYKGKWKVTGDDHADRLKKLYHPVITSLLWKASMKLLPSLQMKIPYRNLIIVKYEDLVTSPESTIKRICDVIDEEYEPEMLNITTHNSSNSSSSDGIFSTSVDRWKTDLLPEEISISQLLCKKQLNQLGYPLVESCASPYSVLINFVTFPYALWCALDANKDMRGPLLPYVFKRLTALIRS